MEQKKPAGTRGISDLKARLGLKPVAPPPQAAPQPGAAVPPPPGYAPPPAAAPDLARDPFAVQVQPAPPPQRIDFVVPDKWEAGGPAEAVQQKSSLKPILIIVAVALVPLVVGYACGRINASRADVNLTIEHAKKIKKEVDAIAKVNQQLEDAFDASMQRQIQAAKTGKQPAIPDMELVNQIKELNPSPPTTDNIFRTNYYHMKDLAIERLFTFYYSTVQLYEKANLHARRTTRDKELLQKYGQQSAANRQSADQTFGIIIDNSGAVPLGKLVMVGELICKPGFKTCEKPSEWDGFWVRSDQTMAPSKRKLHTDKDSERLILLDKTPLFSKVIVGSPEALAAEAYGRRLAEIKELVDKLKSARKDVVKELDDQSNKPTLFHL